MVIFLNKAGLNLYFKQYEKIRVEGDLLSGIISAIGSISQAAMGEEVKEIRAVNRTFHIKEANDVIVGVSTVYPLDPSDMQALLHELLRAFLGKYQKVLERWGGNTAEFADADEVIEPVVQKFEKKYDELRKKCAMILTTGKTPEPLIRTIKHFRPEYVCFLSSKDVIKELSEVLTKTGSQQEQYEFNFLQIENINDINHCSKVSEQAFNELFEKGFQARDIYVDITGGTKVMSAGLTIAAVKYYSPIVYVGGELRDEFGRVIGDGKIYPAYNPYEFFAAKQIERGLELFNDYRLKTAKEVFEEAQTNLKEGKEKKLTTILRDLAKAYGLWDRFHYGVAFRILEKALNDLRSFYESRPSNPLKELRDHVNTNLETLSHALGAMKETEELSYPLIVDMFMNALRRAEETNFDDAVTRLHRLLGMLAQYRLQKEYEAETLYADLEKIRQYDEKLAEALNQIRHERKQSIMANGVTPISAESFERLKKLTENLLKEEIPDFEKNMQGLQFPRLREDFKMYLRENE
nr:TIGR02710 family CRISPR-associated CARF protein [Candidatus Freyarchaeota archaeon]